MPKARILLVEDHVVLRQGLKALFAYEPDLEIVGEAGDGHEALELISELHPDVILMDISMPGLNGIETTQQIRRRYPQIKVVALSMHTDEEYVFQMLRAGASGYVLKQSNSMEVLLAIRTALTGGSFLSPLISNTVINEYIQRVGAGGYSSSHLLTKREREVLQFLAEGFSNQEIAQQLNISVKTVESHRSNMMNKLGLSNKTELIKYAIRQG
jgi:DNA-binding NarL/FixJ family response regulator